MRNLRAMQGRGPRWHGWHRWFAAVIGLSGLLLAAGGPLGGGVGTALAVPPAALVAAGQGDSCTVLSASQHLWCWGTGPGGGRVPSPVKPATTFVSVANGATHSCAIDTKNNVWCWGSDIDGELGNGTTGTFFGTPAKVAGLKATQIGAGTNSTCALTVATTVMCWGDNNYGELGDGNTADSSTPQPVGNLTDVVTLAVGYFHACAAVSAGTMACWGDNGNGELAANPATTPFSDLPIRNDSLDFITLAAGFSDTCGTVGATAKLYCWGSGFDGVLGNGGTADEDTPTPVLGLTSGVIQVSPGLESTCARTQTQVWCWGDGSNGQLGDGQWSEGPRPVPQPVFGLTSSAAGGPGTPLWVATGDDHSCVALYPDQVKCWGRGLDGQLGNGIVEEEDVPTSVIGLPAASPVADQVSAGYFTGCVTTNLLEAECWGQDPGNGDTLDNHAVDTTLGKVVAVSSDANACALLSNETVQCWGDNTSGELGLGSHGSTPALMPAGVPNLSNVVQLSAGAGFVCAVVHNGGADCWGENDSGELGDGSQSERDSPTSVANLPQHAAQISAGAGFTCAVLTNGRVNCWGDNNNGDLGNNSTSQSSKPVQVKGLTNVVQVAAGSSSACALLTTGEVDCWGANGQGELGNNSQTSSSVPVTVQNLPGPVAQIAMSGATACAIIQTTQAAVCWGNNNNGELGANSTAAFSLVPVAIYGYGSGGAAELSAGEGDSFCLIDSAASNTFCWGNNQFSELGDGTSGGFAIAPQQVVGIS